MCQVTPQHDTYWTFPTSTDGKTADEPEASLPDYHIKLPDVSYVLFVLIREEEDKNQRQGEQKKTDGGEEKQN